MQNTQSKILKQLATACVDGMTSLLIGEDQSLAQQGVEVWHKPDGTIVIIIPRDNGKGADNYELRFRRMSKP